MKQNKFYCKDWGKARMRKKEAGVGGTKGDVPRTW